MYKLRWDVVDDDDESLTAKRKNKKVYCNISKSKKQEHTITFYLIVINRLTNIHGLGQ